jgi:shikimate dehydrogenase
MYGIIGFPLEHSFSPTFFSEKFRTLGIDERYAAFPLQTIAKFPGLLSENPGLKGLNVTIPYKEQIIPFLDRIEKAALQIGAVNCIHIANGQSAGYNTDYIAFRETLKPLLGAQHEKALVLGTGGAAKAVAFALSQLDIPFRFVSRTKQAGHFTYSDLGAPQMREYKLIINTTPLGMSPATASCPDIPYALLSGDHLLYDLIYNPNQTLFLKKGSRQGAQIKNGHDMLVAQAEASWRIWEEDAGL